MPAFASTSLIFQSLGTPRWRHLKTADREAPKRSAASSILARRSGFDFMHIKLDYLSNRVNRLFGHPVPDDVSNDDGQLVQ